MLITSLKFSDVAINKIYPLKYMVNVAYVGTYDLFCKEAGLSFVSQGLVIPRQPSTPSYPTIGKI